MSMADVTLGMVLEARERLKSIVRHTDLVPSRILSIPGKREVTLKTECLQLTGSFKVRGAYNMISHLPLHQRESGVIAASAGNHAQGVALAAQAFHINSTIVMPEGAPLAKIAATRDLGAEVVLHGLSFDDAMERARQIQMETGATFVHAFNDPLVVAGQGSIGLEIMDDSLNQIDTVVVPVGGGGMISGIAVAIKELHPNVRIIGVQAAGCPSMVKSMKKGEPTKIKSAATVADGIAVKAPGDLTYALCQKYVDQVVTVDEDEIANAILMLLEKCKIVAEGAGAVSVAAVMQEKFDTRGKICCVISGGNIDVTTLQLILDRGLMKAGRLTKVNTMIQDRPGRLHRLLAVISDAGANVVSIRHDRTNMQGGIGLAMLELVLETNHQQHLNDVLVAMQANGYKIL
ncbi:threonine ammonia-lyase [Eubacteriales bacterium OttesenSCG-928-N13]|nr:threonine ammonia-lyase [Eubacteriales bacterium OttesenSCG-928-N13]